MPGCCYTYLLKSVTCPYRLSLFITGAIHNIYRVLAPGMVLLGLGHHQVYAEDTPCHTEPELRKRDVYLTLRSEQCVGSSAPLVSPQPWWDQAHVPRQ